MKSTVEQLSPTRVKINVEVPFDELKPSFDRAYKKIAAQVRIPGFRPGKAPARVLESRIGRAPVLDEVVNEIIPQKYLEAVRSGDVQTLGQPDFEVTKLEDREVLEFTAEVDVRPNIVLPDVEDISVSVDDAEEADVEKELDLLRARFGTLQGVDRPAQHGDFVSIDLAATVNGEEVPDASTTGLSYEIGSGDLVDGIDDAIIGANEGESKTFTTKLVAGEYAGSDAEVTVTVNSVKERELPEADDEFAQLASEFDTVEELREDLRKRLTQMGRMQQAQQAQEKVLEVLLDGTDVPLPEKVLEAEIDRRKHDAVHPFDHDEDAFKQALEAEGKTWEEFEASAREESEKSVRRQLLLDTLADADQVDVNDMELTQQIIYQAQRYGISPDEFMQRVQQSGQLGAIYADVRRSKALGQLVREVTVTDASGAVIDLNEFFPDAEAESAESDELAADDDLDDDFDEDLEDFDEDLDEDAEDLDEDAAEATAESDETPDGKTSTDK